MGYRSQRTTEVTGEEGRLGFTEMSEATWIVWADLRPVPAPLSVLVPQVAKCERWCLFTLHHED